ncbi:MAG: hypothetical protein ACJ798_16455 [Phenylobacterium sp.]
MISSDPTLRPFNPSGYEIFDDDYAETGEVVIWSRATLAPRLGDRFNIETHGAVRELAVEEVRTFKGGWSITCREDC